MKNYVLLIVLVAAGLYYFDYIGPGPDFSVPAAAASSRTVNAIETYEFTALFDDNRPFSGLARSGNYTVIEGFIDSCSICKQLETDLVPFLRQRPDVVVRRVRFAENGVSQSFSGNTQQEFERQMGDYFARLGKYNFNHVEKTGGQYRVKTCGTPHIEIYGPDRQLIATDQCAERNSKKGLAFMRNWIAAERH